MPVPVHTSSLLASSEVRIVTDSVADIPPAQIAQYGIHVLPVYLMAEGKSYRDDGSLEHAWFYDLLKRVSRQPQTAAPPPQEFLAAYRQLAAEGAQEVVGIFTAATMSSIYEHACLAARECQEVRVHVFDSQQVTMGLGWLVLTAAQRLAAGVPLEAVLRELEEMRVRTRVIGVLDGLDYLHRSGRVGWTQAQLGSLFKIKPVIVFEHGEARLLGKVRTYRRALEQVRALVAAACPLDRLAILHSNAAEQWLTRLKTALQPLVASAPIPVINIGNVFATHVGPGALGVALVADRRKNG